MFIVVVDLVSLVREVLLQLLVVAVAATVEVVHLE
jgi:hypothetical protein|tara:strand:+ start:1283 stop:1387 length:105 start_codon:yes stop_codon:yes gene_type:complete